MFMDSFMRASAGMAFLGALTMSVTGAGMQNGGDSDWAYLRSFVPAYNRVWTSAPVMKTVNTVYGPVMGNGNMAACIGGADDSQVYYMRTADFWTDDGCSDGKYHDMVKGEATGDAKVREIPSGCLTISLAATNAQGHAATGVVYGHEERILDADVHSTLPFAGCGLRVRSYVAATENTMVVELSSAIPVNVSVELNADVFDRVTAYPVAAGVDGDTLWMTRETNNREGARWISRNAYATRILGAGPVTRQAIDSDRARATFEIPANATVTVVTCLDGGKDAVQHLADAKARVAKITPESLARLSDSHRNWWKTNWWSKGFVRTYDDTMDGYYFRCLYQLGAMCRPGYVNSGLHGPWKTSDTRHNFSSYCMNDLGAASYYIPLIASDRAEASKMWTQMCCDWIPEGRRRARVHGGMERGIVFPTHWAPWNSTYEDVYWGQRFGASMASVIGNWYCLYTDDVDYLRTHVYPFMRECADFYEDHLDKEADGKYHARGASYESASDDFRNSCMDLIFAGILFADIVPYSKVLGIDADRRAKWEEIRDNLTPYMTTTWKDKTVYKADATTRFNYSPNVIQTQVVYPGYASNRRSDAAARELGHNTLVAAADVAGAEGLGQGNMCGQGSFVAAQRIGSFKVEDLIASFKAKLLSTDSETGASAGVYPPYVSVLGLWEFNNQLCLQRYGPDVMFFPDWPVDRRLLFKRLLAPGAFLCSGEFKDGAIAALEVQSLKGNPFRLIAPWGADIKVAIREVGGKPIPTERTGDVICFNTVPGSTYEIVRRP